MSAFTILASLLSKLVPVVDATTALVRAAKESLRPQKPAEPLVPPPPIGESGARQASAYLDGAIDEQFRQQQRERAGRAVAEMDAALRGEDAGESEQPLPEEPSNEQRAAEIEAELQKAHDADAEPEQPEGESGEGGP